MDKWSTEKLEILERAIKFALNNDDDLIFSWYAMLDSMRSDVQEELDRRRLWGE